MGKIQGKGAKPIPKSTLLRFPLILGGFIGTMSLFIFFRKSWMGDIETERNKIYQSDVEGSKVLAQFKKENPNRVA